MKPPQYTTHEVVTLLFQGSDGIDEMLKDKFRLKDGHLLLILELAAEYIAIGQAGGMQQPTEK
jgi:hypothetical protein